MPDDPTPHGGEVMHTPPDRAKIPEPKPGADSPPSNEPGGAGRAPRPEKPDRTEPLAGADGLPPEFLP